MKTTTPKANGSKKHGGGAVMDKRQRLAAIAEFLFILALFASVFYLAVLWASTEPEAIKHIRL